MTETIRKAIPRRNWNPEPPGYETGVPTTRPRLKFVHGAKGETLRGWQSREVSRMARYQVEIVTWLPEAQGAVRVVSEGLCPGHTSDRYGPSFTRRCAPMVKSSLRFQVPRYENVTVALSPGKEPTVPTGQEAGWAPEPVWTQEWR